jgi:hypothetical protein
VEVLTSFRSLFYVGVFEHSMELKMLFAQYADHVMICIQVF